jgi:4-hydroxybenzoate polyprenyltransferase
MKTLFKHCSQVIATVEAIPQSLPLWSAAFLAIIAVRFGIESALEGFAPKSFSLYFFQLSHLFLFFLLSYLLLLPLVKKLGKTTLAAASQVLLFGFSIIWLPPILDKLIFGNNLYWSFYIFDRLQNMPLRFFTFFGKDPHIGITYGVRIEVALVLLGLTLYGYLKTHDWPRTLGLTLLAYLILFILGTLPSWIGYLILGFEYSPLSITHIHLAETFLAPENILSRTPTELQSVLSHKMSLLLLPLILLTLGGLWRVHCPKEFLSLRKNIRLPQIFYHGGLLLLGMLLAKIYSGALFTPSFFSAVALLVLLIGITSAWLFTVVQNDIFDQTIDALTNTGRPLITRVVPLHTYRLYAFLLLGFALFTVSLVSFQALLFLILYCCLATLYSMPPFRLKRFLGIATGVASLAGMTILLLGYTLAHPAHQVQDLPLSILVYLAFAYAASLPLKDFKDTAGDKKDKVYTLPVVLGIEKAKTTMSGVTFLLFLGSIFVMNTPQLLLWALLFGSLAFWIVQKSAPSGRFSYQRLPLIFMLLVTLYGLGVGFFLF